MCVDVWLMREMYDVDMFNERKFDNSSLSEIKLKGQIE